MKGSSNDNDKVYDSGYANTSVSHSQMRSSRDSSSLDRKHTNQSDSGGISGGTAVSSDLRNYALPQPIKRRKIKDGHKTTQSKPSTGATTGKVNSQPRSRIKFGRENDVGTYDSNGSSSDFVTHRKKREIDDVELADDIETEEHNGDTNSTELERGIGMITNSLEDTTSNINATFTAVVSMKNGLIVEVTPSLTATLGYTRKSWINHSFIDFVHPNHKQTFSDHLAKTIVLHCGGRDKGLHGHPKSVFCSLRENREQKSSVGSASDESSLCVTTSNHYVPFHLRTSIKVFRALTSADKLQMMFLIVKAEPIMPIYKVPEAMILSRTFSTRHDCNCILTHVEVDVVQYFGYMPQDMIGRSLFDFYHPDDLPFLKGVYETVVKTEGLPFRSTPYRFVTQNGDYVLMETAWSAFFNPWIEKIEFVVGLHRILRGPTNPNVFQAPSDRQISLLANISKDSEIIQNEIRAILNEKNQRTEDHDVCEITSSSLNLDKFVKNLLREVTPLAPVSKEHIATEDKSFLKLDTAINRDSNSCTESPPSYGRLNFIDKITRYFDSNLLINRAYGSDEGNMDPSLPSNKNDSKPISNSANECHTENEFITGTKKITLSGENLSSGSNNCTSSDSRDDSDNSNNTNATPMEDLQLPTLTESVLNKHNQEMENLFLQQHKKCQCKNKNTDKNKDSKSNDSEDKPNNNKRSIDQTKTSSPKKRKVDEYREGEQSTIPKCDENARTHTVASALATTKARVNSEDKTTPEKSSTQNFNSLPPVTLPVPSQPAHSHFYVAAPSNGRRTAEAQHPALPPLVPVYCVPLPQIHNHLVPTVTPTANRSPQLTYVSYAPAALAGVIYPPILCAPEPVTRMYDQFLIPRPAPIHQEAPQTNFANARQENLSECIECPASQATSIKAEIGSTMALSEDTKKQVFLGERLSSCISIDGVCSSVLPNTNREINTSSQPNSTLEDSSDSSFYSSFLSKSTKTSYDQNEISVAQHQQNTLRNCMGYGEMQIDQLTRGPPWQEIVGITDQLIYRYQLTPKPLNEVLEADMQFLRKVTQPSMVSDQLVQMYSDIGCGKVDFLANLMSCGVDASMNSEGVNSAREQLNTPVEKEMRSPHKRMRRSCKQFCSTLQYVKESYKEKDEE